MHEIQIDRGKKEGWKYLFRKIKTYHNMDVLVVGLGVIGTTYGLVFKQAGHNVEHYIKEGSRKRDVKRLTVSLLDGRKTSEGIEKISEYTVQACSKRTYDIIVISVTQGKIADVMQEIKHAEITGTVLLCCNIWYNKQQLNELMMGYNYVLGFPVAGGSLRKGDMEEDMKLDACLFNHFMLEREDYTNIPNYQNIYQLFTSCNIKLEHPHDMLEWIWLHMALNAAVISVAGKYGDITNSSEAARSLMHSVSLLKNVIKVIRETTKIVASRGVTLSKYYNELWFYKLPACLSAHFMKRMFARNQLTRRIMELHGDTSDLLYICKSVYQTGTNAHIPAPQFYSCMDEIIKKTGTICGDKMSF